MSIIAPLILVYAAFVNDLYVKCQTQVTISKTEAQLPVYNETAEILRENLAEYFSTPRHHLAPQYKQKAKDFIWDSFLSYGMRVENQTFETENKMYPGDNIIGIVEGEYAGTSKDKITLVGAHYDTNRNTNGVDDNGSGVAAMLEVAKELTKRECKHKYTTIFVAFDMDETEQADSISACFSRITCGCSSFLSSWLYPYLEKADDPKMHGAIILESIMNFDDNENTQDIQHYRNFENIGDIEANGYKGDFLGLISRKADADLAGVIVENWRTLPEQKYKIQNLQLNIEGVPTVYDQTMHSYFMQSEHFNFWNEDGMKAVYLTDTREARGIMKECYHDPCDNLDRLTDDKLRFLAKTVRTLTNSLHDLRQTDFDTCKPELKPNDDLDLVVQTGHLGSGTGNVLPNIGLITMVALAMKTAF